MEHRIRALGIAPYEGMKHLMASLQDEYPQIDLTLFVGDRDEGLEIEERLELVIPVTEEPVILRCQILRKQELRNDKLLYATKFVDMCEDEEVTVREAVFSIQLESRSAPAVGTTTREEQQ